MHKERFINIMKIFKKIFFFSLAHVWRIFLLIHEIYTESVEQSVGKVLSI